MDSEFWQPIIPTMAEENRQEMQVAATSSLIRPAVVWRKRSEDPIFVRLLNDSEFGMTFVCPVPLEMGESIELTREVDGAPRITLHVARCEHLAEDIYRVSTHV